MRQNKYDDPEFFLAYSQFPRSAEGLSAAGEWDALQKLLPDFAGKRVLDIGCGFGWHCIYAAEHGAAAVLGIDISERMLAVAREKTASPMIEYRRMAMEDMNFTPPASFDVVLSSLAFHYTPDFEGICRKVARLLAPGGKFVFSCEHPVFTAEGSQNWILNADGAPDHWPVDRYFEEGERTARFLDSDVVKYHRTLTSYMGGVLRSGFAITGLVEPQPAAHLMNVPGMADELRRPMMLIIAAEKR